MRRIWTLIVVAEMSTLLFAQSPSPKPKSWAPGNARHEMITSTRHPVNVTGNGLTTPSGVRYWDVHVGSGGTALRGHTVTVLYRAWVRHGKQFAGSDIEGKPSVFTLGAGQVIEGWEDGIEGMKVGGKRQLVIPPSLAYGKQGAAPSVPPNATLIFDIELVGID